MYTYIYTHTNIYMYICVYIYIFRINQGDEGVNDSHAVKKTWKDVKRPVANHFLAVGVDTALALVPYTHGPFGGARS